MMEMGLEQASGEQTRAIHSCTVAMLTQQGNTNEARQKSKNTQ